MRVLLTGANGRIGNALIDQLGEGPEYEFTCLDIEPHEDRDTVIADISDYESIEDAFRDQDAVIHLAAVVDVNASWETVHENDIIGTYNVIQAAAEHGVETVIFGSSIHAVGMYEIHNAPDIYEPDNDLQIDHTTPTCPDSFYGLAKVFAENLGRFYVESDQHPLTQYIPDYQYPQRDYPEHFYSLRIKSVRTKEYDHPYGDAEKGVDDGRWERDSEAYRLMVKRLKSMWLSHRDLADLVECCLHDSTVDFDIFYGVSDNSGTWVDIDHAREIIGYNPQDNGADWDAPPNQ